MTETDLSRIESELGVTLPRHYRQFVLAYPQSLREARFTYNDEPASATFLLDDPQAVIDSNREVREPDLLITDSETGPWPDDYLIIGKDVGGNFWCVKLAGRCKSVWFFDHEEGVFRRQSRSLAEHERYALRFVEEINREE